MRFLFITLFPEQIEQAAGHSIIKRAVDAGLVEVSCINPRDFATDRHRTVDDTPFGGGAGMVLKPEPMVAAIRMAKQQLPAARVIAMCPGGRTLKQDIVEEYARSGRISFWSAVIMKASMNGSSTGAMKNFPLATMYLPAANCRH